MSLFGLNKLLSKATGTNVVQQQEQPNPMHVHLNLEAFEDKFYRLLNDLFIYHNDVEYEANLLLKEFETPGRNDVYRTEDRFHAKVTQINQIMDSCSHELIPSILSNMQNNQAAILQTIGDMKSNLQEIIRLQEQAQEDLNNKIAQKRNEMEEKRRRHEEYLLSQRKAIEENIATQIANLK
jgi:rubrerythrin